MGVTAPSAVCHLHLLRSPCAEKKKKKSKSAAAGAEAGGEGASATATGDASAAPDSASSGPKPELRPGQIKPQTSPPSIPVRLLFKDQVRRPCEHPLPRPQGRVRTPTSTSLLRRASLQVFPPGQLMSYKDDNLWRETSAEKRELERLESDMVNSVRQAAEVHRQVREHVWRGSVFGWRRNCSAHEPEGCVRMASRAPV